MTTINQKVLDTPKKELDQLDPSFKAIITEVWDNKDKYVKLPSETILLWPGEIRQQYHTFTEELKTKLREKKIPIDSRSNGPAVVAYLYAGGERPIRSDGRLGWSIHHIYDGKHPFEEREVSIHIVKDGNHFTQSAGLVAVHSIADALCDEFYYFAWLLRHEAFKRFGYDPDKVFSSEIDDKGFKK